MFQFQTGSIKSLARQGGILLHIVFQFQTGSIKSLIEAAHGGEPPWVSIPNWFD